jgi:hypothetical protein
MKRFSNIRGLKLTREFLLLETCSIELSIGITEGVCTWRVNGCGIFVDWGA